MKDLDPTPPDGYIVPATEETMEERPQVRGPMPWLIRGFLLLIAALMILVFFIATKVQPYKEDGTALREASHQTLGLPPCRFRQATKMPCPSCGMTTSFALLVRGDVSNSLRANWVGTGLAVFCALLIPWCIATTLRGKYIWAWRIESTMGFLIGIFTILMLGRWGVLLLISVFE